ncbi:MAG: hypothetical protein LCH66_14725 [Actinobacteria bacterium]|jgi:hypothetical protein|nr:hypothetical protein [Actinomycetota bacterium]
MNETVAALLGVALGGAFSLIGQWVGSSRSHRFARGETDRQARISAVADFSRALVEYRMAALTRGMTTFQRGAASEDQLETHRRARATAWHAYYRIQMLLPESPVAVGARALVEEVGDLKHATNEETADQQADAIRERLTALVTDAARELS